MLVEVGLIAKFVLALSTPTVSASILITGMLVFSGLGSLTSERFLNRARVTMPVIFAMIGALLIGYAFFIDAVLDWIGTFPLRRPPRPVPPPHRPAGLPDGLPARDGDVLARPAPQGGTCSSGPGASTASFSVIGSAAIPVLATSFGLTSVLQIAGVAYLLAIPAFFAVLLPASAAPCSRRLARAWSAERPAIPYLAPLRAWLLARSKPSLEPEGGGGSGAVTRFPSRGTRALRGRSPTSPLPRQGRRSGDRPRSVCSRRLRPYPLPSLMTFIVAAADAQPLVGLVPCLVNAPFPMTASCPRPARRSST